MLTHLTIRNYALIEEIDLSWGTALNVITGETGAGKSILLGAMELLTGSRADTKVLWNPAEKCVTEGTFDIRPYGLEEFFSQHDLDFAPDTVIRREIQASGKSRAFINDTPVTLDVLRHLGNRLMDIHSQHDTLALANRQFQQTLVDAFAKNESVRADYHNAYQKWAGARAAWQQLQAEAGQLKAEADFIRFQWEELEKARLEPGEQELCEAELRVLENAADIKLRMQQVLLAMDLGEVSVTQRLNEIKGHLQPLAALSPRYAQWLNRLESLRIEAKDLGDEFEREGENVEAEPGRLAQVQDRLSLLYQLQQKHRRQTVGELIILRDELAGRYRKVENLEDVLAQAEAEEKQARQTMEKIAGQLTNSRLRQLPALCKKMEGLARQLGMPDAHISFTHQPRDPGPSGSDEIELLFSANRGVAPQALAQVASGGEFSRLMFCFKYVLAERTALPTLVLDEIDTGISGEVALQMGRMMRDMAQRHQLITITHLPQIAARGNTHFVVFKETRQNKTRSRMAVLDGDNRIEAIARMIAGDQPSAPALAHARELLSL